MQKDREKVRLYNALYILVIIIIGVLCIVAAKLNPSDAEPEYTAIVENEAEGTINKLTVYVTGEIENPGLYEVKYGTRVQQIIELAGGATLNADLEGVNLAKIVKDGDQVKVPALKRSGSSGGKASSVVKQPEVKVDINSGNVSEYMKIKGVTEEIATNIVSHIATFGTFQSIEEMQFVKGMTPAVYSKIEAYYK